MLITLETAILAIMAYLLGYAYARLLKDSSKLTAKALLEDTLDNLSARLPAKKIKVFDKKTIRPEEEDRNPNK